MTTVKANSIRTFASTLKLFWRPTGINAEPGCREPSAAVKVRPCSSFRTCTDAGARQVMGESQDEHGIVCTS